MDGSATFFVLVSLCFAVGVMWVLLSNSKTRNQRIKHFVALVLLVLVLVHQILKAMGVL